MSEMPMEIWASRTKEKAKAGFWSLFDKYHVGPFGSPATHSKLKYPRFKYHHDDKLRALEAENKRLFEALENVLHRRPHIISSEECDAELIPPTVRKDTTDE